jgi:S-adenosylmethionine hydrolase
MPILTLTTDIGQRDFLVGAIKGQFLSVDQRFQVTDITHYLSQTNFPQAAYICANAFKYYPAGTFHLVLINLYENPPKQLLVAKYHKQVIICPDNGILTMITGEMPKELMALPVRGQNTLLELTQLVADSIIKGDGEKSFSFKGATAKPIVERYPLRPTIGPDWMDGQILFIDSFENVVVNITKDEFETHRKGRKFKIFLRRNDAFEDISNNYTDVPGTEKLAWFNSAGYLELALRNGNIAGLFGLQVFNEQLQQSRASMENKWFYQTIKVIFE